MMDAARLIIGMRFSLSFAMEKLAKDLSPSSM